MSLCKVTGEPVGDPDTMRACVCDACADIVTASVELMYPDAEPSQPAPLEGLAFPPAHPVPFLPPFADGVDSW